MHDIRSCSERVEPDLKIRYDKLRDFDGSFIGGLAAGHFAVGHFAHAVVAVHGHVLLHLAGLAFVMMARNLALITHAAGHGAGHPSGAGKGRLQQKYSEEAYQSSPSLRRFIVLANHS